MLRRLISIPEHTIDRFRNERRELKRLCRDLSKAFEANISDLPAADPFADSEAFQVAVENLTNVHVSIKKFSRSNQDATAEACLDFLQRQIAGSKQLLLTDRVSRSGRARSLVYSTMNPLFAAGQKIKQRASIISDLVSKETTTPAATLVREPPLETLKSEAVAKPFLSIHSSLLYQLRHSLFPAERMIVAAGFRDGGQIRVSALFDVTGNASAYGVNADPERLARALISMSETGTHLVAWIHSHPGTGACATHPSIIDRGQEKDWLQNYSPLLLSAIVVRDGFVRFWGEALENGKVDLRVHGAGVRRYSDTEFVYELSSEGETR